ncbi:MAG: AhpC/TSA family protein, partial [Ferruginibacter sp.]|nr:AhpC/TSA family protein [Ferruginibacter sp.]
SFITLTGKFADMKDSAEVSFLHPSSQAPLATAFAKNKTFKIFAPVNFAGLSRLTINNKTSVYNYDLFIGPETATITGTLAKIETAVVKGAKYQADFKTIIKKFEPNFKKLNTINQSIQQETDPTKRMAFANDFNGVKEKIKKQVDSLILKKSSSPVASFMLYITKDLFKDNPSTIHNWLTKLKAAANDNVYANALKTEISEMMFGAIGSPAIDFIQNDTEGKPISLSSFKGKYVLLDFWASWCRPCREENPNVVKAYNKFKEKKFTVLGISLDRPDAKDNWIQAIKDDGLTWTNVSDLKFWQNEVAQKYKVGSIPQNYLIDPQGIIIAKNLRGQALEDKLCEVLGCN